MRRNSPFASMAAVPLWRARRGEDQRDSPRLICGPGQMVAIAARGKNWLVPVYNISDGGLMIRLPCKLAPGESVAVALGGGRVVEARIRWLDGERAGLGFTCPPPRRPPPAIPPAI